MLKFSQTDDHVMEIIMEKQVKFQVMKKVKYHTTEIYSGNIISFYITINEKEIPVEIKDYRLYNETLTYITENLKSIIYNLPKKIT